jgi:hypothetical protein
MSLADSFLTTAKDLLMMSENIKRMDSRVDKMTDDVRSLDRRVMKIELMVDLAKDQSHRDSPKRLK